MTIDLNLKTKGGAMINYLISKYQHRNHVNKTFILFKKITPHVLPHKSYIILKGKITKYLTK